MAGIGFQLRKMIESNTGLFSQLRIFASAGLISSGPWIVTMVGLLLVAMSGGELADNSHEEIFLGLVTYSFAFSLLTVGVLQMAFTRWLADELYSKRYERIVPCFISTLGFVAVLQTVVGWVYCSMSGFGPALSFAATALYVTVSLTWVAFIWLTIVKEFEKILIAYIMGMVLSWISIHAMGDGTGVPGALAAYGSGQALTLVLLIGLVIRGAERGTESSVAIFGSLNKYRKLVGVGFFYSGAIWVDKMVFWFLEGENHYGSIWFHPLYDNASFFAYMTIIPALALNLVFVETTFYDAYRSYYASILNGFPLPVIEERREKMTRVLREGAIRLIRVQGAVTAFCIILAPLLFEFLGLPELAVRVFRFCCLGALFHVLTLVSILILLYFDCRRQVLVTCIFFFIANLGLAMWSATEGMQTYGIGYAVACFLTLLLAFTQLSKCLVRLEYRTFATLFE